MAPSTDPVGPDELADQPVESTVDWSALPDAVRTRIAELGAEALGALPPVDIPQQLRAVARFTPAKRARLGGAPLIASLRDSVAFRTAVVEWCRKHRPSVLDLSGDDPVAVAAAAVLLGEDTAGHYLELVSRRASDATLRSQRDSAVVRAEKAENELAKVRAELDSVQGSIDKVRQEGEVELERLRKRLREQGVKVREARDAASRAGTEIERVRAEATAKLSALTERQDREHERAEH